MPQEDSSIHRPCQSCAHVHRVEVHGRNIALVFNGIERVARRHLDDLVGLRQRGSRSRRGTVLCWRKYSVCMRFTWKARLRVVHHAVEGAGIVERGIGFQQVVVPARKVANAEEGPLAHLETPDCLNRRVFGSAAVCSASTMLSSGQTRMPEGRIPAGGLRRPRRSFDGWSHRERLRGFRALLFPFAYPVEYAEIRNRDGSNLKGVGAHIIAVRGVLGGGVD